MPWSKVPDAACGLEAEQLAAVRTALLVAVARGRARPAHPAVSPVPHRQRSPLPEGCVSEELELCVERDHATQAWMPLRIVYKQAASSGAGAGHANGAPASPCGGAVESPPQPSPEPQPKRRPVVIFLHPTGGHMNELRGRQEDYARAGYLTAAVDCRYHGERAHPALPGPAARAVYEEALVKAWRDGVERPFLLDNVWDLLLLVDYLLTRADVDAARIGVAGFSLGGMHAWLLGAADTRIAAVAAVSGVQGFGWAVRNNSFHDRVASIPKVFAAACADMQRCVVDAGVVHAVWCRIAPGLVDLFDGGASLPLLAPRPLLVASGEKDGRCPLPGMLEVCARARAAYVQHAAECVACERARARAEDARQLLLQLADGVVDAALVAEARRQLFADCTELVWDAVDVAADRGWEATRLRRECGELLDEVVAAAVEKGRAPLAERLAARELELQACKETSGWKAEDGGTAASLPCVQLQDRPVSDAGANGFDASSTRGRAVTANDEEAPEQDEVQLNAWVEAEAATAEAAVQSALDELEAAMRKDARQQREEAEATASERMVIMIEAGVGHTETPRMQRAVREFMDMHLLGYKQGFSEAVRNAIVTL